MTQPVPDQFSDALPDESPERSPLDDLSESGDGANSTVQVFVSLYLILIAFFMVMNSISNQETVRAAAAMDSVHTAFRKIHLPKVDVIDLLARRQLDTHSREFYEEIEGVLAGLVDFPGKYPSPGGNIFRVEMPASTLFQGTSVHVRPDQTLFMNALADLLKREAPNEQREVEILFAAPRGLLDADAPWQSLFVRRAANIAAELEDRGVPG
ncbi:MAG: hypothetical protein D6763_00335, partial [Alphaproteobacteria bacterium]